MKNIYLIFLLSTFIGFSQSPGDIVITEIMQNPSGVSDDFGEWFELYNTTASNIDLNGWTIKDDGSNTFTITTSLIVPSGGYISLGRGGVTDPTDPEFNGGITHDFVYDPGFLLSNNSDEIIVLAPGDILIDEVFYDNGNTFPDPTGASMQLDTNTLNANDNDNGLYWCEGTAVYDAINNNLGTPAAANEACPATCLTNLGSSTADCDSVNPGDTDDTYTVMLDYTGAATGEVFEVTTTPAGFTVGGDDPTTVADGTIMISGISEGTDITISVSNIDDGGLCDLSRDITSPVCIPVGTVDLELQGIIDFDVPEGGASGKAIHLIANANIADLSEYGLGSANNGGGTDGQEYTFPVQSVNSGDHILLVRDLTAMENYLTTAGYNLWDVVLEDIGGGAANGNGNDAVELFKNGAVVETFGDINDGNSSANGWDYEDSWAYKDVLGSTWPNGWIYGDANCTDDTATTFDSTCVYPFVASLSNNLISARELSIFPNPVTNGIVNINSTLTGKKSVELYDLLGRNVIKTIIDGTTLDVNKLRTGVYLMKITIENKTATQKLIIK